MAIAMTAWSVYAQGDGAAGIVEATDMVTSYFDPAVWHESYVSDCVTVAK